MPNRSDHQVLGGLSGVTSALQQLQIDRQAGIVRTPVQGSNEDWAQMFQYMLAGGFGGYIGGVVPDELEPASNPHHRQFFHSVAFSTAAMIGYESIIANSTDPWVRVFVRGVQAGHLSHVVADSITPRGIPIFGIS